MTFIIFCLLDASLAGDWPCWRFDAGRRASTEDAVPADLKLQWTRDLPRPKAAWPESQTKLQFDASYEPIVIGQALIVPSMVSDKVTAYETRSGKERWRFYADGPVRFAAAGWRDRVFFVSDDGFLYCLNVKDGTVAWKFRGGPQDRHVLGNERLISMWPARGAPVVFDDKVYFAAGIFGFMGIFIHALDAETGKVIWTNSGSGSSYQTHQHGSPAFAGVSPQGYLAATDEYLLVSGGRSVPGVYERRTGKFLYFHVSSRQFGKGPGGFGVTATENLFFNGACVYGLRDGRGYHRFHEAVHDGQDAYFAHSDLICSASPRANESMGRLGTKTQQFSMQTTLEAKCEIPPGRIFFKAKNLLFCATKDGTLLAYNSDELKPAKQAVEEQAPPKVLKVTEKDLDPFAEDEQFEVEIEFELDEQDADEPEQDPEEIKVSPPMTPAWQARIQGEPWSMLPGDDRVFVVTKEGKLHCFGQQEILTSHYSVEVQEPLPIEEKWTEKIDKRLPGINDTRGTCLVLGLTTGKLIHSLLEHSQFHIVVVERDAEKVAAFRRRLDARGIYGRRVAIHPGDPFSFRFPPYLATLIVCESLPDDGLDEKRVNDLVNALRPYGGIAYFPANETLEAILRNASKEMPELQLATGGGFLRVNRRGPLPNAGRWTHQYADAANSVVSYDWRVRTPLGLLWFGGPSNDLILPRHGHGPNPQVVGGRLFIEGPDILRATDVYTGRLLWQREIPNIGKYYDNTGHHPGANEIGSNYVSQEDSVYVMTPSHCMRLDPATGKTIKEFVIPAPDGQQPPKWGFMTVRGELLVAAVSPLSVAMPRPVRAVPQLDFFIPQGAEWHFLAGEHPADDWIDPEYQAQVEGANLEAQDEPFGLDGAKWKSGKAGFGFGDGDDRTELKDMHGKYSVVYIRTDFVIQDPVKIPHLVLAIRYDDAFIAYLNGKEVIRKGVGEGRGKSASKKSGHEARGFDVFEIKNAQELLRTGNNVLAIEGHNRRPGSSDFTLDPALGVPKAEEAEVSPQKKEEDEEEDELKPVVNLEDVPKLKLNTDYASGSRQLICMNRITGKVLWTRKAAHNFRHNAIVLSKDKVFCIDKLSDAKLSQLKRRGYEPKDEAVLYALDSKTGEVVWKANENVIGAWLGYSVIGTWLGYSEEHDVLIQAGSQARDRARDEAGKGMMARRGADGSVLWSDKDKRPGGPCILHHGTIITQGAALDLLTGEPRMRRNPLTGEEVPWSFRRNYGCNTAIASEHLITFRSAAAGYFDLRADGGTGNLGGFRTGCSSNLIAADGVLNAPDYTRTCACAYQVQTSLAMVHMPDAEMWTFNHIKSGKGSSIERVGINFGAPGDRRAPNGTLWLEYPVVGGPSPPIDVTVNATSETDKTAAEETINPKLANPPVQYFRHHQSVIKGGPHRWVTSSGMTNVRNLRVGIGEAADEGSFTIRIYFAETQADLKEPRTFSVSIQGKPALDNFTPSAAAGGLFRGIMHEFKGIPVRDSLSISFSPAEGSGGPPILCGIELLKE